MRASAAPAPLPGLCDTGPPLLRLTFVASPAGVREALACVMRAIAPLGLAPECAASTELVLAEVLNNVVEHAYSDGPGPIMLELRQADGVLACTVSDRGLPMPDGTPPSGRLALHDVPLDDLPEGGFGWYLIRSLTRDLDYVREPMANRLMFLLPLDRRCPPA